MKTITRYFFFLSLLFSLFSCANQDDSLLESRQSISGEDYFKAIFLNTGTVADKIPALRNSKGYFEVSQLDEENLAKFKKDAASYLQEVRQLDPNFLTNLKKSIDSKNHLQLRSNIMYGAKLMFHSSLNLWLSKLKEQGEDQMIAELRNAGFLNSDDTFTLKEGFKDFMQSSYRNTDDGTCIVWALAYQSAIAVTTYGGVFWVLSVYAEVDLWGTDIEQFQLNLEASFADGVQKAQTDLCVIGAAAFEGDYRLEILVSDLLSFEK